MSYTIPYSFVPGTKARAQEVNANFASILDSFDDLDSRKMNLDLSNITSAGIDVIKNNSSIRNLGELVFSTIPLNDSGLHLLNGALLQSGGVYDDFVKYIKKLYNAGTASNCFTSENNWQSSVTTYGECGKFVYNATNNTVRLPKVKSIIQCTTNNSDIGNITAAGLPNITGTYTDSTGRIGNATSRSGALNYTTTVTQNIGDGANTSAHVTALNFDASKSSSIYGNSSTVQPQTVKYQVYIVVATIEKTDIQIDIDNVTTDLNGKADVDGTNMASSVKKIDGQWIDKYVSIADGTSLNGSTELTYTLTDVPNDGYKYEVLLSGRCTTGSTSGNSCQLAVRSDFITGHYSSLCYAQTRTSNTLAARGSTTLPLTSSRKIYVYRNSNYNGTFLLELIGYRRIGTNS